jgi:Peptidase A4 family
MPTVRIAKGLSVQTFPEPPENFQPLAASERARARYGYPPRPAEAPLAQLWENTLGAGPRVVQPQFRLLEGVNLGLPDLSEIAAFVPIQQSTHLCGGDVKTSPDQGDVRWVESTWTVPNIYPAWEHSRRTFYCVSWIGIIGIGSSLQAGIYSTVRWTRGQAQRTLIPFWRWSPGGVTVLSNFSVLAGDVLSCVVCLDFGSSVTARLYFYNVTSKQVTTFKVNAPSGTQLNGNTASWVIQSGEEDAHQYLARMGQMYFDRCNAGTTDSPDILNPATLTFMTQTPGFPDVAVVSRLSDPLLQVTYVGD